MSNTSSEVNLNSPRRASERQAQPSLCTRTPPEALQFYFFQVTVFHSQLLVTLPGKEGFVIIALLSSLIYFVYGTRSMMIWFQLIIFEYEHWLMTRGC